MEKLALLSMNNITAVESVPNISESKVLTMMKKIEIQASQFRNIKQFYYDFQKIQKDKQNIDNLMNNIKTDSKNQFKIQELSRLLAQYTYSFFEFVNFSQQYVKKHTIANLNELLIKNQYDKFYEYRLAYSLGNYVKHVDKTIPLKDFYDENSYNFYIPTDKLLDIDKHCKAKIEKVYKERDKVNLIDYLNTTLSCIKTQTMYITKQIFVDEKAGEYFQSTDRFIAEYGFPCKFDFDNLDKGKVQLKDNDILSLRLEVAKIVGEFGIADIKIHYKK